MNPADEPLRAETLQRLPEERIARTHGQARGRAVLLQEKFVSDSS